MSPLPLALRDPRELGASPLALALLALALLALALASVGDGILLCRTTHRASRHLRQRHMPNPVCRLSGRRLLSFGGPPRQQTPNKTPRAPKGALALGPHVLELQDRQGGARILVQTG